MRFTLEKASEADGVERATQELISFAVKSVHGPAREDLHANVPLSSSSLVKDSRSQNSQAALKLLITTAQQKIDNTDHQHLLIAILQLFQSAVEYFASLSSDITTHMTSLSETILSTFTSRLRSMDPSMFFIEEADTLQRVGILSAVSRYRAQASLTVDYRDLANTLCVRALKTWNQSINTVEGAAPSAEAACVLLDWVIAQSNPSTNADDMKAFFAMWLAFAVMIGEYAKLVGETPHLTLPSRHS